MKFQYNDGGRAAAGVGVCGDCVTRAIAVATQRPYQEISGALAARMSVQRVTKNSTRNPSVRNGVRVQRQWFKDYMASLGFRWVPTMKVGGGCKVHLRESELPSGRLVVRVSRHCVAVLDGVIHDTHDPSREGTRCVYGYWQLQGSANKTA